ncbi:class I SAM-dependent methyltransferase [Tsuneonella mangrovi]|uniref:class I SAM-dependent methyltransferase n=1 Tax=Tsuneonella mangrovi TaxID=1982042 RepID=UPI000BA28709|nr:class I SAM-dependent methyltransferase [Tsuneonella mangrovi]
MWDKRFSEAELAYGDQPNDFLRDETASLRKGKCLCLADGQGRNGVWLAQSGFEVTAMDQSAVGLGRAQELAAARGVTIQTVVGDLADFDMGAERWDSIVSIFVHLPPPFRIGVHARIVRALKPGGTVLIEAYTPRKYELPGFGGPPPAQSERTFTEAMLRQDFAALDIVIAREVEREVNEGKYHHGLSETVQFLARKPIGE